MSSCYEEIATKHSACNTKILLKSTVSHWMLLSISLCCIFGTGCNSSSDKAATKETASVLKSTDSNNRSNAQADIAKKSATAETTVRFATHGKDLGLDFTYQNGEAAWLAAMIESNGGGIAYIDFDRDGLWDIFVPGGGRLTHEKEPIMVTNGLFRQRSIDRFDRCDSSAGVSDGVCYSFGANVGDYDSDGFPDIFITGYFGQQLLRNMGDGTFEDVTAVGGFHHKGWSSSSAWFDLDNDGDLDIYVSHYGIWSPTLEKKCFNAQGDIDRCAPADFAGEPDEIWINEGDGTFRDQSHTIAEIGRRGIGVVACDFDQDGDADLYVSNDEDPNSLFDNLGNGELKEVGAQSGTSMGSRSIVDGSMGLAVGDFDGNMKPDILVTNYQNEYCELYLNQSSKGSQYFSLGTRASGLMALGQAVVGWGTAFFDADHDGDEDLIVVAGHTSRRPIKSSNLQKPYYLDNVNHKRLVSMGDVVGEFFQNVHAGRGLAIGDLDNDGDVDFVVSMVEQPIEYLKNTTARNGHYLLVDLIGTASNRDAVGAYVELQSKNHRLIRNRISGGSYGSTHASTLHFGLGEDESAAKLTIHWPGGKVQTVDVAKFDQRIVLIEE